MVHRKDHEIGRLITMFGEGRYPETVDLARKITADAPDNGLAWKVLAAALACQGRMPESLEPMHKAVRLLPKDAEAFVNLGKILGDLGRPEEAAKAYRSALGIDPEYARAHFNLGATLRILGRPEQAEPAYRSAIRCQPEYAEAYSNLGNALAALGRLEEAEEAYRCAIRIKPDFVEARSNLGNTLKDLGRPEEAEEAYRSAIRIKPDFAEAHANLGLTLKNCGRLQEAEACYRRALEINPQEANTHYNLGDLLCDLGEPDAAAAHFRSCLEIDPADALGARLLLTSLGAEPMPGRASEAHLDKLYARRARTWDQGNKYFGHHLVAKALTALSPGSAKLDIRDAGCGTGRVGVLLRGVANRLDGIDMSSAMLEKVEAGIYDRTHQGDLVSYMNDNPDTYDAVTCAATLIHFGDLSPAFDAAAVALKDDGLFVFTLFPNDNEQNDREVVISRIRGLARGGCYAHSPGYVRRLAESAGFDIETMNSEIHEYHSTEPVICLVVALRRRPRAAGTAAPGAPTGMAAPDQGRLISLFQEKRYPETVDLARKITADAPDNGLAWKVLAVALTNLGRTSEAIEPMRSAVRLLPNDAEAHFNLGVALKALRLLEQAEEAYRHAIRIRPDFAEAHYNLGNVLKGLDRLKPAEEAYRTAVRIRPEYAEAHYNLGVTLRDLGKPEAAEEAYRTAIRLKPDYAEAYSNLGGALRDLGQLEQAEKAYQATIRMLPEHAEAHYNLGNVLQMLRRFEQAGEAYRATISIKPEHAEAHSNLGLALKNLGRLEEAKACYLRALEINSHDANTHYNLGDLLCDLGELEAAAEHFRSCLEIDPSDSMGARLLLTGLGAEPLPGRASDAHLDKIYARRAQTWDQGNQGFGHHLVAKALTALSPGPRKLDILDAGCGTGRVGVLLREVANRLDGIDMSSAMLEKVAAGIYDRTHQGDLVSFMIDNPNTYDAVTCAATLIHFGDLSPAFDAAAIALKDDGLFIFTLFPNTDDQNGPEVVVSGIRGLARGGCYAHSPGYVGRLAESAGFDVESLNSEIHEYHSTGPVMCLVAALRRRPRAAGTAVPGAPTGVAAPDQGRLISLFQEKRYPEAVDLARKVTTDAPDNGLAWKVLAVALTNLGRTSEAIEPMRSAVRLLPNDAEAHFNLGVALKALRQLGQAEEAYRNAIRIKPDFAEAHYNLGNVLKGLDRSKQAEEAYRTAVRVKPEYAEAHYNLGATLHDLGQPEAAEEAYRTAIRLKPTYAEAHYNLGVALNDLGKLEQAEKAYRTAIHLKPEYAEAYTNLGGALKGLGQLEQAEKAYRATIRIQPECAEAYVNLGVALKELGRPEQAEEAYRTAIRVQPECAEAFSNLGNILQELGRLKEAEEAYRTAIRIMPEFAEAHYNYGNVLQILGQFDQAEQAYRSALRIKPEYAEAHSNLGNALKDAGRLEQAEEAHRAAIRIKPDFAEAHSNLLFSMSYNDCHGPLAMLEEARRYGRMVTRRVREPFSDWLCPNQPELLRVGLVSGDLRNHPVAHFLESTLSRLAPERIELIAYSTNHKTDELTSRIRPRFSAWKSLIGLSDEKAAQLIHSDGVQVLIDLSGHSAYNRLPVFAWKPAPVQATWLGFLGTTGVAEIDYLLGDPQVTPPENDGNFSESVWRLPDVWCCLTPPDMALTVAPLPALSAGGVTFGSFNNLCKMTDQVVALWTRVLKAVPGSRLFLKTKQLGDPEVREYTRQRFTARGIEPDRLILEGASPRKLLLEAYNRVDIALDPFPYGGATTTCEALWMAVPFVTLKGDQFLSRCGLSLNTALDLTDWIADDQDDYVAKAVLHSHDLKRLATVREGLRERVLASPIFDADRFARHLEAALWGMWDRWPGKKYRQIPSDRST